MPWLQLKLQTSRELASDVEDFLQENHSLALTLQDSGDQPLFEPPPGATPLWDDITITALFEAETELAPVVAALQTHFPRISGGIRVEALEDKDWEREWMANYHPMRFGQRLWVVPSWLEPPEPNAVIMKLDPGLAFGTGTHPTTALCLEWLDGAPLQGANVVDYGCGSGILAIAALLLGADHVTGVDNDPQALLATGQNAERNEVAARLTIVSPERYQASECDILVANILAGPLIELAPKLSNLVRKGGQIALSGILHHQAESVMNAYAPFFLLDPIVQREDWVRISGHRFDDATLAASQYKST
ncbi:Ribosomal protein L11 methyltransferase [gamma proteobacterium HdN1]|nr:Ribosomal protein L11 methyltransferase [gamma proteobacterium HdN1]